MEHRLFSAYMMVGWWMMSDIWMDSFFLWGCMKTLDDHWTFQKICPKSIENHRSVCINTRCLKCQDLWWQLIFLKFSSRSLGKWSNLTSIFFKWMVQPPTSQDLFFSQNFLRRTSSGLVVFDKFLFPWTTMTFKSFKSLQCQSMFVETPSEEKWFWKWFQNYSLRRLVVIFYWIFHIWYKYGRFRFGRAGAWRRVL